MFPKNGESPSGKAPGFGPGIRGFESLHPSHGKSPNFAFARFGLFLCLELGFGEAQSSSGKACFCQNKQAKERSDIPPGI